jgi:diguanylate cyclase (GGDEF)-like protein/PAS domain S-box-containing protein
VNRAKGVFWFKRLSIRMRLVSSMLALALFVILAGSIATVKFDQQRLRDQLVAEVHSYGQALTQDFARLILVDSIDHAADLVNKLKAFPDINRLVLQDTQGRVVIEYVRSSNVPATTASTDDPAGVLHIDVAVEYQNVLLGQAMFEAAETRILARNRTMVQLLVYFVPAIILVSVLLSLFLQRQFSAPLLRLTEAIRRVSSSHDYSMRLPDNEHGEYGELFKGFNDMMDRVEAASGALSDQTERLQVTLESIGDGVLTTNTQGEVQYMNPAAARICQQDSDAAIGKPVDAVCRLKYPGYRVYRHPVLECLKVGEVVTVVHDCNLWRDSGEVLPVQTTAAPILGRAGEMIGTIMVLVDVSHARAMAEELGYRASHDPLTDLLNRYGFERELQSAIEGAKQRDEQHALLYLDLDQFKVVNDTGGHQVGDELLRDLAGYFKTKVRAGDSLARMGGDEFAVILRHCPLDNAQAIAEEVRGMVLDYRFNWNGKTFDVGVSVGVTAIDAEAGDAAAVMSNADSACYAAKEAGRNRVYVYRSDDKELAQRRGDMARVSRIRSAIEEQRLVLHAQPIFTMDGTPSACEVLIRMLDEQGQLIGPGNFLPAAERYGLIEQLDRWVFEQVTRWLCDEVGAMPGLDYCSVNVSPVSLGEPEFVRYIHKLMSANPRAASRLCIEITETSAISSLHKTCEFMESLAGLGVRFALDDFGTGMSSLSFLKQLPVDMVKIDGAFVRDMMSDPVDQGMVRAINEIAQLTNKRTIAEFVEDQASLDRLAELGVDYAQGFHLGRPLPLQQLLSDQIFSSSR